MSKETNEIIPSRIIELSVGLDVGIVRQIDQMISSGVLSPEKLVSFLKNIENKYKRREKANIKRELAAREIKYPILVSRGDSQRIWEEKSMVVNEDFSDMPDYFFVKPAVDDQEKFHWAIIWVNGLSVKEIMKKFPGKVKVSKPERYDDWYEKSLLSGYFLVSLDNFLLNYPVQTEEESIPSCAWRAPINYVLETLITLEMLGRKPLPYYLRTGDKDRHGKCFCVGKRSGAGKKDPFELIAFNGGRHQEKVMPCLTRNK